MTLLQLVVTEADILLTTSCSSNNWRRWFQSSSISVSYCKALQYIQQGILQSCHKFLWCYFQKLNHSRGRLSLRSRQRKTSQRGRKPDNMSRIISLGTFPIHRLMSKLMVLYESMWTAFEVSERHSKSTVNARLLRHLRILQGRTYNILDLSHSNCLSNEKLKLKVEWNKSNKTIDLKYYLMECNLQNQRIVIFIMMLSLHYIDLPVFLYCYESLTLWYGNSMQPWGTSLIYKLSFNMLCNIWCFCLLYMQCLKCLSDLYKSVNPFILLFLWGKVKIIR